MGFRLVPIAMILNNLE